MTSILTFHCSGRAEVITHVPLSAAMPQTSLPSQFCSKKSLRVHTSGGDKTSAKITASSEIHLNILVARRGKEDKVTL